MNGTGIGLTPQLAVIMQVIQEIADATGTTPSYAEIANELEMKSRSTAHEAVVRLIERGFVHRLPGRHRCLGILRRVPMPDFSTLALTVTPAGRAYLASAA